MPCLRHFVVPRRRKRWRCPRPFAAAPAFWIFVDHQPRRCCLARVTNRARVMRSRRPPSFRNGALKLGFFGGAAGLAAFEDVLFTRPGGLHHPVKGAGFPVYESVAEILRGLKHPQRFLVGEQILVSAVRRNEATWDIFRKGRKGRKRLKGRRMTRTASLFGLFCPSCPLLNICSIHDWLPEF